MIKKLILFGMSILVLCACDHNLPIAKLKFLKVEKVPQQKDYYYIWFTSDIELKNRLKEKHTGAYLACFLSEHKNLTKDDFIDEPELSLTSFSPIEMIENTSNIYKIEVVLNYDSKTNFAKNIEIETLLEEEDCIPCAVYAVAYMNVTKQYISETMCIPIESFL